MSPCARSSITSTCSEESNPFMALADAAASILDSTSSCDSTKTKASTESQSDDADSIASEKKLSFAEQLMAVLDDESKSDVIAWMPDGKSFTIIDSKKFTKVEMPKIFNIRNMSSFVRKLTRWGFNRFHEKATMNSDIFKHKDFQKGNHQLCATIKCLGRTSSSGVSKAASRSSFSKPSLPPTSIRKVQRTSSICSTTSTSSTMSAVHDQKTSNYLEEARRLAYTQEQLMKANPLAASAKSQQSNDVSDYIGLALESLVQQKQAGILLNRSSVAAAKALALHNMIDASSYQQHQLAASNIPNWLVGATSNRISSKGGWGGYPSIY